MKILYDSDSFVVVHLLLPVPQDTESVASKENAASDLHQATELDTNKPSETMREAVARAIFNPQIQRHGFEIVDKRTGKEVYLDGSWAEMFQAQNFSWQEKMPTEEEFESILEDYAALAQNPVLLH